MRSFVLRETDRGRGSRAEASQELLKVERGSLEGQNLPFAISQFTSVATDGETIMNEKKLPAVLLEASPKGSNVSTLGYSRNDL